MTIFGHISDDVLEVLYTYCDIFCMPSRMDRDGVGEGLPVALMEAMSYEKPVVATTHTGIPESSPRFWCRRMTQRDWRKGSVAWPMTANCDARWASATVRSCLPSDSSCKCTDVCSTR